MAKWNSAFWLVMSVICLVIGLILIVTGKPVAGGAQIALGIAAQCKYEIIKLRGK
jgi:hypothetical protein